MSQRLTTSDWIRHGLRTLAHDGPGGLKVGPMSEKLKVSRGSFYWHFRDLADFKAQLLSGWQEGGTEQVIQDLEAANAEPDRLKTLMRRAFRGTRTLERAMRTWASEDADVAAAVSAVDARRIAYISDQLIAGGVPREPALQRATFLYWAFLGQAIVMDPRHASIPPAALDAISDLLEAP